MLGSNIEQRAIPASPPNGTLTLIYTLSGLMCAIAGIIMVARFNSVRVGHGDAYLLITVLACFLGGVDPFGGFGRVVPVVLALVILQVLSSGLNLVGANQHLSTAVWGLFLIAVMVIRFGWQRLSLGGNDGGCLRVADSRTAGGAHMSAGRGPRRRQDQRQADGASREGELLETVSLANAPAAGPPYLHTDADRIEAWLFDELPALARRHRHRRDRRRPATARPARWSTTTAWSCR